MARRSHARRSGRQQARQAGPAAAGNLGAPLAPVPEPSWVRPLWYLAAVLTAWSFGFAVLRGSDLWWHLAAGRWITEHRALPETDPWGFPAGRPWLNHEWLSDVLYDLWVRLFGMPSLVWWKWGLIVAAFVLLFHLLLRRTGSAPASYLAMLLAGLVAQPFLDIRPHLYSLVGFVLVLCLVLLPPRPSRLLPLVFLVWANLHSGFLFGLAVLAAALGARVLWGKGDEQEPGAVRRRWIEAAVLWLACAVASLINPYGIEVFLFPLRYAAGGSSYVALINEWQPPFVPGGLRSPLFPLAIATFLAAAAYLLFSGGLRRDRAFRWTGLALGAVTLIMALRSRRFISFFAVAQTLPLATALAAGLAGRLIRWRHLGVVLPVLALLVGVVRLAPYPLRNGAFHSLTDDDTFPVDACNFLRANGITGKVFADYAWGGYLELCAEGRVQVFIDGRADTVYGPETFESYLRVLNREPGWQATLEATGAEYVLGSKEKAGAMLDALVASGRWRPLHEDYVGVLLARSDVRLPSPLRPAPDSAWRDLAVAGEAMRANRLDEAERALSRSLERMPDLDVACENLAVVQAARGDAAAARQTERRCQRIFPDPVLRRDLERMIR